MTTPAEDPAASLVSTRSTASPSAGILFRCTQCYKSFTRRENLSRHSKTHNSSNTHHCNVCSKSFTRSDMLKRHHEIHLKDTGASASTSDINLNGKRRKTTSGERTTRVTRSNDSVISRTTDSNLDPALRDRQPSQFQLLDYETQPATSNSNPWSDGAATNVDSFPILSPEIFLHDGDLDDWFSDDFFAALRETGYDWVDLDGIDKIHSSALPIRDSTVARAVTTNDFQVEPVAETTIEISSPPNEPSEEDKWPFAWNPRSNPLMHADNMITIASNHELFRTHDSAYDISAATYQKVIRYIDFASDYGLFANQKSRIVLPELPVMNLFIGLFFKHFYQQMPVIHLGTLDINKNLPPVLLAAMIIIGAIYSHQRHTRRFAIVLLDLMRKSLLMSIECDNSLMRDPITIYTLTLICHTGLWCGNKRAFELAEVIRGSVINYCRRTGFGIAASKDLEVDRNTVSLKNDSESQWKHWIGDEFRKRLCWAVYSLDCQFPSLLNLPCTISRSEISALGCPCDDEFWQAPSAWHWRRLLGPASVPPSVSFATAIGPFVVPPIVGPTKRNHSNHGDQMLMIKLNAWSKHLVLLSIQSQIYEFSQELIIVEKICIVESPGDPNIDDIVETLGNDGIVRSNYRALRTGLDISQQRSEIADQIRQRMRGSEFTKNWSIWQRLATTKLELSDALSLWSKAHSKLQFNTESSLEPLNYFTQSSDILEKLGRIMLDIPLTDLQDAIGKSGASKIPGAMSSLSLWIKYSPQSVETALDSLQMIHFLSPLKHKHLVALPSPHDTHFSIIAYFICHITLWAFVGVADKTRKNELMQLIENCDTIREAPTASLLKRLLAPRYHGLDNGANYAENSRKLLFRSAVNGLTRMGTWGCALNLAMMLHKRAEI